MPIEEAKMPDGDIAAEWAPPQGAGWDTGRGQLSGGSLFTVGPSQCCAEARLGEGAALFS